MFNYIDPTISLFGLNITWYAIFILTGILVAVIVGIKEGKKLGICTDDIYWGVILIVPCAIIGARLWYILFNLDQHWSFARIIGLEGGLAGLAIQGGLIVALIVLYIYTKKKDMSLYRTFDIVAPGFFIGQIFGRWGNFCNHELYGPVVKNPSFLKNIPILGENMYIDGAYRHPTFLYESGLNLIGLIILLVLRRKYKNLKCGDLMGVYLVWYGIVRIFTEALRMMGDPSDPLMLGPIPVSILISILFIISGITFLIVKRYIGPKENYQEVLAYNAMRKPDTILFDLDGTLLDTKPLIDRSFIHTFSHFRPNHILTDEELDSFFGPTLYQTFSRYSDEEKEIEAMIAYYREFNIANHDSMVKPMPGAKALLSSLSMKGYNLGVVSSKKTDLVNHGLELFDLLKYMDVVIGCDEVSKHKPAPDGIELAIKLIKEKRAVPVEENFKDKLKKLIIKPKKQVDKVLYVGDTMNDILAGKNAKIGTVGCLYISNPDIMLEAKPDYVIDKLNDILRICME